MVMSLILELPMHALSFVGPSSGFKQPIRQDQIEEKLGSELGLLTRIIPAIGEIIVGDNVIERQNETAACPASLDDSKNRIHFAFLRFMRVVATHFEPLIMVLDDLQWADGASLELLPVLLSNLFIPKIMVLGLYRSDEVSETHILHKVIRHLETKSIDDDFLLIQIVLKDLDVDAVHRIIQEVLGCQANRRTVVLARTCLEKTNGNPFFLIHYLKMLEHKKLLQFNFGTLSWTWDDVEIRSNTDASDNVVDILKGKMRELSAVLLQILTLASCLGSSFEVGTLRLLWQKSRDETNTSCFPDDAEFDTSLEQLEAEGLIVKVSNSPPRQRWVHDKIHEAAIDLIPESERAAWSRSVGEMLLSHLGEENLDSSIFVVVNLLNVSAQEGLDVGTRMKIAHLNYEASVKAVQVSAFESASKFASIGVEMLPTDSWNKNYDLTLKLYSVGAKAEGSVGNVSAMEKYCKMVMSRQDIPLEDKFDVYHTWIDSILNLTKVQEAADLLLDILGKFKCRFPKTPAAIGMGLVGNVIRIKATMKSRDPSNFASMKETTRIELMRFLDKLSTCFYILKDDRMPLVIFRSLNWTVKYGVCGQSHAAFATTGMMLTGILDDIQGGARYGHHAIALLKNKPSRSTAARTMFCVYSFLLPWTQPYRNQIRPLLEAYHLGLQTGDTESATWAIFHFMVLQLHSGISLHTVEADMFSYSKQMKDLKREQAVKLTKSMRQVFLNLLGQDNVGSPIKFTGRAMGEEDLRLSRSDPFWNAGVLNYQGMLFTYFGEHSCQADVFIQNGHDYLLKAHVASPNNMADFYLKGVSCFAMARKTGRRKYAKLGHLCRAKIKRWLDMGNPNVKHYESLLDAEYMALKGRKYPAMKQYEVAILLAARGGYQQDAALASERLGEFQMEVMNDYDEGKYRIGEAIKYWGSWGAKAKAKVEHLEKKHHEISAPQQPSMIYAISQ